MAGSGYEGGTTTDRADFGLVLRMYERRRDAEKYPADHDIHKDTFVGNAVLVGPRLAITAVHCLADPKRNLWVSSALGGSYVRVICLRWRKDDHLFLFGSAAETYPPVRQQNWEEDIVALFLDDTVKMPAAGGNETTVQNASVESFGDDRLPGLVGIAAADGSARKVRYSTFLPRRRLNALVTAEVSAPFEGYPLESGSAVLAWDRNELTTRLLGLQVSAPNPIPLHLPDTVRRPRVGILPLTTERIKCIEHWRTIKSPVPVGGLASPGPRAEELFYLRGAESGRVISGERELVTVNDLDFFGVGDWKDWTLHATRSRSGILTSGGIMLSRRIGAKNAVALKIQTALTRESVEVELYPSGALGVGGFCWLHGLVRFQGCDYHLYLFRAKDDVETNRRRVRIAIFDAEGPHLADRPEYNEIVFGSQLVSDDDRVQDDIGNGHEGQDPP